MVYLKVILFPLPLLKAGVFFFDVYYEDLVELLVVNLTIVWGLPYDRSPWNF